jgi:hypothetical protein
MNSARVRSPSKPHSSAIGTNPQSAQSRMGCSHQEFAAQDPVLRSSALPQTSRNSARGKLGAKRNSILSSSPLTRKTSSGPRLRRFSMSQRIYRLDVLPRISGQPKARLHNHPNFLKNSAFLSPAPAPERIARKADQAYVFPAFKLLRTAVVLSNALIKHPSTECKCVSAQFCHRKID